LTYRSDGEELHGLVGLNQGHGHASHLKVEARRKKRGKRKSTQEDKKGTRHLGSGSRPHASRWVSPPIHPRDSGSPRIPAVDCWRAKRTPVRKCGAANHGWFFQGTDCASNLNDPDPRQLLPRRASLSPPPPPSPSPSPGWRPPAPRATSHPSSAGACCRGGR